MLVRSYAPPPVDRREIIRYMGARELTEELTALLEQLRAEIAELDAAEPEDMESEEYEEWGDAHEDLEDQVDEILDLLESLK